MDWIIKSTAAERNIVLPKHIQPILEKRYFNRKDINETTWADLCARVASSVAGAEDERSRLSWAREFYHRLLLNRVFLPNTPTWINAGLEGKRTLSACFVLPLEDTMESILESSRLFGMVQKFGGGTGVGLSKLRPTGAAISSTHGKACGPISVLKYLGATSQMVTQGGARQGANMAVMDIYHPNAMEFLKIKAEESDYLLFAPIEFAEYKMSKGEWTKEEAQKYIDYCKDAGVFQLFNLSFAVDNKFMKIIKNYEHWKTETGELKNTGDYPWDSKLPCGKSYAEVWDAIIKMAHKSGDPGLLFLERAQAFAELHSPYIPNATNPCGEQYLPDYGSCNLGSINLAKFIKWDWEDKGKHWENRVDWEWLDQTIHLAVRFLDDVVTINKYADPEIGKVNLEERRIGLGPMGWSDFLLKAGIKFDSDQAYEAAQTVAQFFQISAHEASYKLAEEKGPFPLWDKVKYKELDRTQANMPRHTGNFISDRPRRNATVTNIAPTGTISVVAGCYSGIEPYFRFCYVHHGMKEHGGLGFMWASETVKEFAKSLIGHEPETDHDIDLFNDRMTKLGHKTTNEISVEAHIKHQSIWQHYIDNAVSKTINLEHSSTEEDIAKAYILAFESGCKGSTVFRDRCKPFQVLNDPKTVPKREIAPPAASVISDSSDGQFLLPERRPRPSRVPGVTYKVPTGEGKLYLTISYDDRGLPFETFARMGQVGSNITGYLDAIARLISEMFRVGIHPFRVVKALRGIKSTPFGFGPNKILSTPDAIGKTIEEYMADNFGEEWASDFGWTSSLANGAEGDEEEEIVVNHSSKQFQQKRKSFNDIKLCHNGHEMIPDGGCYTCPICAYSECG